jgi:hypothetical protein
MLILSLQLAVAVLRDFVLADHCAKFVAAMAAFKPAIAFHKIPSAGIVIDARTTGIGGGDEFGGDGLHGVSPLFVLFWLDSDEIQVACGDAEDVGRSNVLGVAIGFTRLRSFKKLQLKGVFEGFEVGAMATGHWGCSFVSMDLT